MSATEINVRPFTLEDVPQLLQLMQGLARFEGYIDDFHVTEQDLIDRGLCHDPQFEAFVAQRPGDPALLGMTVAYVIPFSHTMRPKMVMKELFVCEAARGEGLGEALFARVRARARELDCFELIWTVLKGNDPAVDFYRNQGARPDPVWDGWTLTP